MMECARRCNIHDEIMKMPMGYETIVGELGLGISGGQKAAYSDRSSFVS
ncbi:hypothetical protein LNQ03_14830 [Klebsiella pneumoniae subsp. pneumoniae]|nr:hypothetical protein [Klebsiella pneumoniae subsp. pneumoniae]